MKLVKRPSVDDVLANGCSAPTTVTRVYGNGQVIDVVDRLNRRWQFERAPGGHWTVIEQQGVAV